MSDALRQALDECSYEAREDYSGRGMNGRTCLGYVLEADDNVLSSVAQIVLAAFDWSETNGHEVVSAFRSARMDSMGMGTIVYFPKIS